MRNNHNGYYKIGISTNPKYRERTLRSEEPDIVLLFSYLGNRDIEISIHFHYRHKHVRGEWFSINEQDVLDIKKYLEGIQDAKA